MKKAEPNSENWSGHPDGLQRAHSQVIFTVKKIFLFSLWEKLRWNAVFGRFCGLYRPELDELSLNCGPQKAAATGGTRAAGESDGFQLFVWTGSAETLTSCWGRSPEKSWFCLGFFLRLQQIIIEYYRTLTIINKHMKIQTNEEKRHLRTYYISK